jgi:hypothetical protein
MYEWIGFSILLVSILVWLKYYYKEGLDTTPMDVIQSQQGEIESIHKQLRELQLNEESIKEIQDAADKTTEQISTLQKNLPDPQVKKYAQE